MNRQLVMSFLAAALLSLVSSSAARADLVSCVPSHVTNYDGGMIGVGCTTPVTINGVRVEGFAISNKDPALADRFVTLATAALLSGHYFSVDISSSAANNVPGCLPEDCRTPLHFGLRRR